MSQLLGPKKSSQTPVVPPEPGSFFIWGKDKDVSNKDGDHVAFVERIKMHEAGNAMQCFDTGAAKCPMPSPRIAGTSAIGGNHEYNWSTGNVAGTNHTCYGFAYLTRKAEKLAETIEALTDAVPLGMARLALLVNEGKKERVLYATPLLDMRPVARVSAGLGRNFNLHGFSIARYLWSLREIPYRDAITAVWLIDIPRGRLARKYIDASDMWSDGLAEYVASDTKIDMHENVSRMHLLDLESQADGGTRIRHRYDFGSQTELPENPRPAPLNQSTLTFNRHICRIASASTDADSIVFESPLPEDFFTDPQMQYFKGRWPFSVKTI